MQPESEIKQIDLVHSAFGQCFHPAKKQQQLPPRDSLKLILKMDWNWRRNH